MKQNIIIKLLLILIPFTSIQAEPNPIPPKQEIQSLYGKTSDYIQQTENVELVKKFEFTHNKKTYLGLEDSSYKYGYYLYIFEDNSLIALDLMAQNFKAYFKNNLPNNTLPFSEGLDDFKAYLIANDTRGDVVLPAPDTKGSWLLPLTFVIIAVPIVIITFPIFIVNYLSDKDKENKWESLRVGMRKDSVEKMITKTKLSHLGTEGAYSVYNLDYFSGSTVAGFKDAKLDWYFGDTLALKNYLEQQVPSNKAAPQKEN